MAKLYFKYGAMGSSKTANALMTEYNFLEKDKKVLLAKSSKDTRDGITKIKSRISLERECFLLENILDENIHQKLLNIQTNKKHKKKEYKKFKNEYFPYDAIIVDEIQFATKEQIQYLSDIVDFLNIPVICYGLRADFQNKLFSGSEALLAIADSIEEIKTICWCGKKAICNARYKDGEIIKEGEQVLLGYNYVSLCRKHYKEGKIHK